MSYYFRPPNSREQNLYIIRFSVDDLSDNNFVAGTLKNTAYTSPAKVFLPADFNFTYNNDNSYFELNYINAKYEIPPTVNIILKNGNTNENITYEVSIISVTETVTRFEIYYHTVEEDNGFVFKKNYPDLLGGGLTNIGVQVQIIGRTKTGPTFAIANQGWTYVESTSASNDSIYSSMKVGTNGVVPPFGLTVGGSYGYFGGAGNGNTPSTTKLENYTVTEVYNNINNYHFFPIKIENNEILTLPVVETANIGQEIFLLLNQITGQKTLTISKDNTNMGANLALDTIGDSVKFIALNNDDDGARWVKVNNK